MDFSEQFDEDTVEGGSSGLFATEYWYHHHHGPYKNHKHPHKGSHKKRPGAHHPHRHKYHRRKGLHHHHRGVHNKRKFKGRKFAHHRNHAQIVEDWRTAHPNQAPPPHLTARDAPVNRSLMEKTSMDGASSTIPTFLH